MSKKKISVLLFIVLMFIITVVYLAPQNLDSTVLEVKSPTQIKLNHNELTLSKYDSFDNKYTEHNKILAKSLGISEEDAFIMGNLAKDWASGILKGRRVIADTNDIRFFKFSYTEKFKYSGFCIKNGKPYSQDAFIYRINKIHKANYKVLDLDTNEVYNPDDLKVRELNNILVIRKSHLPWKRKYKKSTEPNNSPSDTVSLKAPSMIYQNENIKLFLADSTTKFKPDKNCTTMMCKEILNNIKNSKNSIDMAIYGYSRVPELEQALKNAQNRGVKIRLVYDSDAKGGNIYPNTPYLTNILTQNKSDIQSEEVNNIMHNKFYIFDDEVLITGSANLSNTDMSGFNSNAMLVLKSKTAAQIYKKEFEQMYEGKFHNNKTKTENHIISQNISVYFSPKDKGITNGILPLINNAKHYIYIPTFLLTEYRVTNALISAQKRGVEVKIIVDALNASAKHSKHNQLRNAGILVKTENYAGKMHSKSMIIDDTYTIIGSMNFSSSGENKNDENLVIIKDGSIAKFYKKFFLYQWSKIDNKWLKYNARAEGKDSIGSCSDGIDNNYDGFTDLDDPACK